MATFTDTNTVETTETVSGACVVCKEPLKEFVIRGNKSKVVVDRVRLYTYSTNTDSFTCTDCSPRKKSWRELQTVK